MALPKINTPIFELNLPSSGQAVRYRPFLVKEQKILMMAMSGEDQLAMVMAVKQIVNNCMIDPILDVEKMPMFDLEYFFLRLRAKSVGEDVDLIMRHPFGKNNKDKECDGATKFKLNLLDVDVVKTIAHTDKIVLEEETGVGIKFKYPDGGLATEFTNFDENANQMDVATDAMLNCIEYIFDKDNIYQKSDSTREELIEFLDGLSQDQFAKLSEFFDTMPKLKHEIKWTCSKCKCEESITLEGLGSFFG